MAALFAGRYWFTWDRFIGPYRDEVLWLPLAMRANDASLFTTDPLVPALERFFPRAWVGLSAVGLEITGDPGTFTLLASTLLLVVYAVGVATLSLTISGNGFVAAVVGIASLRANVDVSGVGWGILVGNAEPRAFVYAVAPWILAAFLAWPRTAGRLSLLGAAVGLLADIHPTSALHLLALLAGALLLMRPGLATIGGLSALAAGFVAGSAPYALQWLEAFEPGRIPMEIVAFRTPEIAPAPEAVVAWLVGSFMVPLVLAVVALSVAAVDDERRVRRIDLVRLAVVAAAGALAAPLVPRLVPRLFALAPLRLTGYLLLISLVLAGELVRRLLEGNRASRVAAAALAAGLVLTAGGGRLGDLARLGRSDPRTATNLWTDVSNTAGELSRDDFLELCRWAIVHTDPSDMFLTPTSGWASLRLYAARPLYVAYKDGSMITYVSPSQAEVWYRRLGAVNALYAAFETRRVAAFARAGGIRYVVQDRARPALDLPVAHENRAYRVYGVRPQ